MVTNGIWKSSYDEKKKKKSSIPTCVFQLKYSDQVVCYLALEGKPSWEEKKRFFLHPYFVTPLTQCQLTEAIYKHLLALTSIYKHLLAKSSVFRAFPIIYRTNAVFFRTNPVKPRTITVIFWAHQEAFLTNAVISDISSPT